MSATPVLATPARRKLILVGNPNVGKSVLFGAFTGKYVTVSNYPGTTVEITAGNATIGGSEREIIDTPGTNTLLPQSEDECVTRDVLIASPDADVLQVGDLKNLRRTLLLTAQIAEYGRPFTLCLNMSDEAEDRGITLDSEALARRLGVSVVPTAALRRWGLERLKREALQPRRSEWVVRYSAAIERGIARLLPLLPELSISDRAAALAILAGDETFAKHLVEAGAGDSLARYDEIREAVQAEVQEPLGFVINRDRLVAVDTLVAEVFARPDSRPSSAAEWLSAITMHRWWGLPFLAVVLYIAWWFVGNIGAGTLVDFIETYIFNSYVNPWAIQGLDAIARFPHTHVLEEGLLTTTYTVGGSLSGWQTFAKYAHDLIVGEYGVLTMALTYAFAIVLPVVGTFFIFFGILEDSGYLPRLAVMINRLFKLMGLNGKAVLPMVLGLGCDTMATLTTRILETKKERVIVTLLLALGVPCSAQLGVIMAMLGMLNFGATLIWLGVIGVTIFLVGWLSSLLLKGEPSDFILELPPLRMPKLTNILIKVLARMEWYLKEAVPLFVIGTLVLYTLDAANVLTWFQGAISPLVVGMLRLPQEAANAFLIGFLRRDYGAAGLFMMQKEGMLNPIQTVVSLVVITLFIPCIANFLMMIKERGLKMAIGMAAFIIPYAFGTGWLLSWVLTRLNLNLAG
jgi:ferrous iron transport protein B